MSIIMAWGDGGIQQHFLWWRILKWSTYLLMPSRPSSKHGPKHCQLAELSLTNHRLWHPMTSYLTLTKYSRISRWKRPQYISLESPLFNTDSGLVERGCKTSEKGTCFWIFQATSLPSPSSYSGNETFRGPHPREGGHVTVSALTRLWWVYFNW